MYEPHGIPGALLEENAPADGIGRDHPPTPRVIEAAIPAEPGLGAVVISSSGRAFQRLQGTTTGRTSGRWYPATADPGTSYLSWGELVTNDGPLLLVQDTRPEAAR